MRLPQDKLVKTIVANYILWPGAHFINFRFVPSEHRILYNNCVSVRFPLVPFPDLVVSQFPCSLCLSACPAICDALCTRKTGGRLIIRNSKP